MCGFNLSCWLAFFDYNFWQSFVSNASATFLGAILGILGALWLNNFLEKRKKNERKKKILQVLFDELKENIVALEIWESRETDFRKPQSTREPIITLYTFLYTESWDAFSNGGELEWIDDPTTLNTLASAYNHVTAVKYLANKYIDLVYSGSQIWDLEIVAFIGKKLGEKIHNTLINLKGTQEFLEATIKKIK